MGKWSPVIMVVIVLTSGCEPASRLYDTPALYFGSAPSIPQTDSPKQITIDASMIFPLRAQFDAKYKFTEKFGIHSSYCGNFGASTKIEGSSIGDYSFSTDVFEMGFGWINKIRDKNTYWFLLADYGLGRSVSIVKEDYYYYDMEVPAADQRINNTYFYTGKFSKACLTTGLQFNLKNQDLYLSSRQSLVNFSSYQLPDTFYTNKKKFLSDLTLSYSLRRKSFGLSVFLGAFLNGKESGNRSQDNKPELWRIERGFGGLTLSYKFLKK